MKNFPSIIKNLVIPCSVFLSILSCAKDTDLLADYVISQNLDSYFVANLVIDDSYIVAGNNSVVLDVLANDIFEDVEKVKIVETSDPTNGTIIINEDKTLTYFPEDQFETEDSSNIENTEDITIKESETIENPEIEEAETVENDGTEESETDGDIETEEIQKEEEVTETEEVDVQTETKDGTNTSEDVEESNETESSDEPKSDTFTYTTETTNDDGTTEQQEATVTVELDYGELRAFPGAEGFGKYATGGRGGKIIHVTNLNDSGPGSLRDAVENKSGPRTVVFDVSGYINLNSSLKIRSGRGNITIAGQTAPQGGITLRGASVWVQDSNVIMRYIRIRPGRNWLPDGQDPSDENYEPDDAMRIIAFDGSHIENIIIDHCTVSWGRDGILDITTVGSNASIKNVTVQNTILSENVDKGYASLILGNVDNLTFYKNYIAHNSSRNIALDVLNGDVEFINNVIYGFGRGTWVKYSCRANLVGNIYISNPNNPRSSQTLRLETNNNAEPGLTKVYLNDNYDDDLAITYNSRMKDYLYESPNQESGIKPMPSNDVINTILTGVGSSIYRDKVDERVVKDVHALTGGIIKHENEVGGYPAIKSVNYPKTYDSDWDGMSDKWESENNFTSENEVDGNNDHNGDGYTDLEDFLHFLTL